MRIYLDICSLQRPFDDRSHPRVNIEAEAVLTILRLVESDRLQLLTSEAIQFEINRIPNPYRKLQAVELLKLSSEFIQLDTEMETQGHELVKAGVKPMDALHAASAFGAQADYFCSCDDLLLKKLKSLNNLKTKVVSPLELVAEVVS